MGDLANKFNSLMTQGGPQRPSGGKLLLKSVSAGGPSLEDPKVAGTIAGATSGASTAASEAAKRAAQQVANAEFLDSMSSVGKPYNELGINDIMQMTKGDIDLAKKFVDMQKTLKDASDVKVETIAPIAQRLFDISTKIPTSEGAAGRVQKYVNIAQSAAGMMPTLKTYQSVVDLIRPMLAKAMGNVGNLNENEQKAAMNILNQISGGTTTERKQGIEMFKFIMEQKAGRKWNDMVKGPKATMKDLSTSDMIKMIMPQGK